MTARRATVSAVAAVLVGTALVVVLVTWAASIGPSSVIRGEGPAPQRSEPTSPTSSLTPTPVDTPPPDPVEEHRDDKAPAWVRLLAGLLVLAAAAALLYVVAVVVNRGREAYRDREVADPDPDQVDFEVLAAQALTDRLVDDAAEQRRLLLDGSPRNGIVACWHRFEVQAAASHTGRRPSETSAEFTTRLLGLVAADHRAVATLSALYREARFSDHELSEARRSFAVEALDQIHQDLLARTGRPS